jgi:hypothetical protein
LNLCISSDELNQVEIVTVFSFGRTSRINP